MKCSIMINFFLLSNCKIETDRVDSVAMVADLGFFQAFSHYELVMHMSQFATKSKIYVPDEGHR